MVFGSSDIVDRPSERLSLWTISWYWCINRQSRYRYPIYVSISSMALLVTQFMIMNHTQLLNFRLTHGKRYVNYCIIKKRWVATQNIQTISPRILKTIESEKSYIANVVYNFFQTKYYLFLNGRHWVQHIYIYISFKHTSWAYNVIITEDPSLCSQGGTE